MSIKCPLCSSIETKEIIYGEPSSEEKLKIDQGKAILINVSKASDSSKHIFCVPCKRAFSIETNTENTVNEDYVESFFIFTGEYCGPSHYIYIDSKKEVLRYAYSELGLYIDMKSDDFKVDSYSKTIHFSKQDLEYFNESIKKIGVKSFDECYEGGSCTFDKEWRLEVVFSNGINILSNGLNKYPDSWDELINLLEKVTGKKLK